MQSVEVIEEPGAATVVLEPLRGRLLGELSQPASAAGLAARIGLPRQKINYHLRALESHGLVEVAEERTWGGLTERVLVASAKAYVVSPKALGKIGADPKNTPDRLSAGYLIAVAARAIQEVGDLLRRATRAQKRLATLSIDAEIHFRTAQERATFSHELTAAVTQLVAKYHDPSTPSARAHRLTVLAHPSQSAQSKETS